MKNIMHPGQYLKTKYIDTQQKTIKSLANELDITPKKLSNFIKGKQSITYDLSIKLADIFNTTSEFWMTLQLNY
ncbi:Addiction module antidote protein, HigA, partial [Candidatus Magnetomorum sp. HK-1]